jgi:hypothetical protein
MYNWKMIIVDLVFIVGSVFFLSFPINENRPINNIETIKNEIKSHSELTPQVEEYLNKSKKIYQKTILNPSQQIIELNNQYPIEAGIVMNYLYQK